MKKMKLGLILTCFSAVSAFANSGPSEIASGVIFRFDDKVEIVNIFSFRDRSDIGAPVTVVPFSQDVDSFALRVLKTTKGAQCTPEDKPWFEVELEPVKKSLLKTAKPVPDRNSSYPFDVGILSPPVPTARYVPVSRISASDLPPGTSLRVVKAAIDLNGNAKPDIVYSVFCCNNPDKAMKCNYTCTKTWVLKDGKWLLHDRSQPC